MIRVLSPHLDDAVLSLGQMFGGLRGVEQVHVLTVFAGSKFVQRRYLSEYDQSCGFRSSAQAMDTRRGEDRNACAVLGAVPHHLGFLDLQYRKAALDLEHLASTLGEYHNPEVRTFVPLGIGHPDHRAVALAMQATCPADCSLFFYEELPYRVLQPEQVQSRLNDLDADGWECAPQVDAIPVGSRSEKVRAVECYESQFPDGAVDPCLFVPERVWHAVPPNFEGV